MKALHTALSDTNPVKFEEIKAKKGQRWRDNMTQKSSDDVRNHRTISKFKMRSVRSTTSKPKQACNKQRNVQHQTTSRLNLKRSANAFWSHSTFTYNSSVPYKDHHHDWSIGLASIS